MISYSVHTGKRMSGFTLLEVVVALALFSTALFAVFYTAMATVNKNRLTELQVAGTNAANAQVELLLASATAKDGREDSKSAAKSLIRYLNLLAGEVTNNLSSPVRVSFDSTNSSVVYEFPVAKAGEVFAKLTPTGTLDDAANHFAVGVVRVFLNESAIPAALTGFTEFTNLFVDGTSAVVDRQGFDMNGNGVTTDDFSRLFRADPFIFNEGDMNLHSVPLQITLRYYRTPALANQDRNPTAAGFIPGAYSALIEFERFYIVNSVHPESPLL